MGRYLLHHLHHFILFTHRQRGGFDNAFRSQIMAVFQIILQMFKNRYLLYSVFLAQMFDRLPVIEGFAYSLKLFTGGRFFLLFLLQLPVLFFYFIFCTILFDNFQEVLAVFLLFDRSDAIDGQQVFFTLGKVVGHLHERCIGEDGVGRHTLLVGHFLAFSAQLLKQILIVIALYFGGGAFNGFVVDDRVGAVEHAKDVFLPV